MAGEHGNKVETDEYASIPEGHRDGYRPQDIFEFMQARNAEEERKVTLSRLDVEIIALVLSSGLAWLAAEGYSRAVAVIKVDNVGSRRAFEKAGMRRRSSVDKEWLEYEKIF